MKQLIIFLLILVHFVCRAEYDSTYVLSITQKYAIPEKVSNGDYAGIWKKTYTWVPVGKISYKIEKNFNKAFSINSSSGLITISDASKINGKVSQQDTVINLIIKTTDSGKGYELDTAQIRVKENSYCVFNDLTNIKAGYGYFVSRGDTTKGASYGIKPFQATDAHPTIIAAYGKGPDPVFDGSGLEKGKRLLVFSNKPTPPEHCKIYNLEINNYPAEAIRVEQRASHFGFYNLKFAGNVRIDFKADLGDIYTYGHTADSITNCHHEMINCSSVGSYGPILKTDASGMNAYNIYASPVNNAFPCFRFAISYYAQLKHFYFTNQQGGGRCRAIQARSPKEIIEDGIIENCGWGIYVPWDQSKVMWPDDLIIRNVLLRNNEVGVMVYNHGIDRTIIENCLFDHNRSGITFHNGGNDRVIRYNTFKNNIESAIKVDSASQKEDNLKIYRNVIYGTTNAIIMKMGSNAKIYNNTVDGNIDLTGADSEKVWNNYFRSLSSAASADCNISIDTISTSNHFYDYANHNYQLKSTAHSAINHGAPDIAGSASPGNSADIGAYNFKTEIVSKKTKKSSLAKLMNEKTK